MAHTHCFAARNAGNLTALLLQQKAGELIATGLLTEGSGADGYVWKGRKF